jgi:hypothetical protein
VCITEFRTENLKGRDYLEDLGMDGKIILELILGEKGWGVVDWMPLAWNRDCWWAVVNTVMNLQVL